MFQPFSTVLFQVLNLNTRMFPFKEGLYYIHCFSLVSTYSTIRAPYSHSERTKVQIKLKIENREPKNQSGRCNEPYMCHSPLYTPIAVPSGQ